MPNRLDDAGLDLLFRNARSHNVWLDTPVSDDSLRQLYELMKWGPTSANCSPARILFLRTAQAKERLRPALSQGNLEKTMSAPVTAIIGYDVHFYDQLPKLFPHADARSWFTGSPELAASTALRNSSLQGGYFILAARALGLDCGPMSGFDAATIEQEFFADGNTRVNFLCNLGHGDAAQLFPRSPRLDFDEACSLL